MYVEKNNVYYIMIKMYITQVNKDRHEKLNIIRAQLIWW